MSAWKFPPCAALTFTALLGLAGCVTQQKYDALETRYQQLNQTMSSEITANQMQITRLQNAIKVTVNSELLFPTGEWEMPVQAQQTIAKITFDFPHNSFASLPFSINPVRRVWPHGLVALSPYKWTRPSNLT
jgi:outer membrane murein-binding lipoprotein Lpp